MSPRRLLPLLVALLAVALLAPTAGAAAAHAHTGKAASAKGKGQGKGKAKRARKARRRTIDPRLPKAWARRYGVRKAGGDPDHDGLRNLAEARAGLHPKRADTDGDGVRDGDEHPGVLVSIDATGATVRLFAGGTLTAAFGPGTELACGQDDADDSQAGDDDADASDDADDDARAEDPGDDDWAGEDQGDDGDDDAGDDDATDEGDAPVATCDGAAPGDRVYEATVTGGVFATFDLVGP